jgi:hypothetical protein
MSDGVADERPWTIMERHEFRGFRRITRDANGQKLMWPTWVLGWRSFEMVPAPLASRLRVVLDELRRGRS